MPLFFSLIFSELPAFLKRTSALGPGPWNHLHGVESVSEGLPLNFKQDLGSQQLQKWVKTRCHQPHSQEWNLKKEVAECKGLFFFFKTNGIRSFEYKLPWAPGRCRKVHSDSWHSDYRNDCRSVQTLVCILMTLPVLRCGVGGADPFPLFPTNIGHWVVLHQLDKNYHKAMFLTHIN